MQITENEIGTIVVESAIEVHRQLGPGLLESVYELALSHEIAICGLMVVCQVPVPIRYKTVEFNEGFRADMIVADRVILELKSVEQIAKVHIKQLQTYLKLSDKKLGYLLNFGAPLMKDGIIRVVNRLEDDPLRASASPRENTKFF